MKKAACFLLLLGLLRMAGDASGFIPATALGMASGASPCPKVFTRVGGMEPFAARFFLEWEDLEGEAHSLEITPEVYSRVRGPYARRNTYGAVLAAAPALEANAHARAMTRSVLAFAVADDAPLLREIGIDPSRIRGPVRIRYAAAPGAEFEGLPEIVEITR